MPSISFFDLEVNPLQNKITDIGAVNDEGSRFHSRSLKDFVQFIKHSEYICGHNILKHDLKYILKPIQQAGFSANKAIDTLHLSPLLFPKEPYHRLVKDDKLYTEDKNNPLNDSLKARDLLYDEISTFKNLDENLKRIYYTLLRDRIEFKAFFQYLAFNQYQNNLEDLILECFETKICEKVKLSAIIDQNPLELAYCLALINTDSRQSMTPAWVHKNYPETERVMYLLRNKPCLSGCSYCNQALDIHRALQQYFGFEDYRTFNGEPLQEQAVQAAVNNQSLLSVFPTGGGKSLTFQVPALMSGENAKGLTVVISPLQSLMKDQVDNLEERGITSAVAINGLLDPIERAEAFERVEKGGASLLYISPESLRSKTIERLLLGRNVVRFVIDEAHCFSSWGQDFRVDYLYIGDFIKKLQELKNLSYSIPVSCFTATAKQKVIQDIKLYFREKLSLDLQEYSAGSTRTNLHYRVYSRADDKEKYNTIRELVDERNCPVIIYVSRTKRAYHIAEQLNKDGYRARPYHGKMEKSEKTQNQNAFINGETQIMVATSAFGMGVDKKDVGLVIHHDISDSLENYVQEAGRAGRDQNITAECIILFNEEDLHKHFVLHNQTKLSIKEIQQIWKAVKSVTKLRSQVSNSALEIARKAGWNDEVAEIETRVITAIAALEEAGYLKRGQNVPRIYANSILSKNVQEAVDKIMASKRLSEKQKEQAVRIIKKLIASRSHKGDTEETGESRIDYISDHLGIVKRDVLDVINLLREEKILADSKDLTASIKKSENRNRSREIIQACNETENFLLDMIEEGENSLNLKMINEQALEAGYTKVSIQKIKTILNFWEIKNWVYKSKNRFSPHHVMLTVKENKESFKEKILQRHELAGFITNYLFKKFETEIAKSDPRKAVFHTEFSVHELKQAYTAEKRLFKSDISVKDTEDALFYLSRTEALKIEGGFLIVYNRLSIERLEDNNLKRYKVDDYEKLGKFYEQRVQQIHIVGEYAKKMIEDYHAALSFVEDYFQLNYNVFLRKYFQGRTADLNRNITPAKFRKLFGELSTAQLKIIKDNQSQYIVTAAGPGSGKTRVLVHKLAALLLMEDIKHEHLLMVTFSRSAASEFKQRLNKLIGNASFYIEIKTFHSYCFDLLGRVGTIEKSAHIIQQAIEAIQNGEVEQSKITKTVLVIDEAQDMDEHEYRLIQTLIERNEEMRVIAVGDDDQNIYEFRGSDSKYMKALIDEYGAAKYELTENYRSKANLTEFCSRFAATVKNRLKEQIVTAKQHENGILQLVKYTHQNLLRPAVNDLLSADLKGTCCIVTHTNQEALQVHSLLTENKIPSKLIENNDHFNLYNLREIRYFLDALNLETSSFLIDDESWQKAKRALWTKYRSSSNIEVCINLIKSFQTIHRKKKYRSDLEIFIKESKFEDFYREEGETIIVSTIHKTKGKEFDNVFLVLPRFVPHSDEQKRQLYVALTRAKKRLHIHYCGTYLDDIYADDMKKINDTNTYDSTERIILQAGYKDVWLDFFIRRQSVISKLKSGDKLVYTGDGLTDINGREILKFSKSFELTLQKKTEKGYRLKNAKVNFILHWQKEDSDKEYLIVLPELTLLREDR